MEQGNSPDGLLIHDIFGIRILCDGVIQDLNLFVRMKWQSKGYVGNKYAYQKAEAKKQRC